mmetsp:Transcript_2452/g.2304  ORF Transcript_2452/g.2304 Transcript_2452/m.2304 type:complete len:202 (+) Transcript_2452:3-608(+)
MLHIILLINSGCRWLLFMLLLLLLIGRCRRWLIGVCFSSRSCCGWLLLKLLCLLLLCLLLSVPFVLLLLSGLLCRRILRLCLLSGVYLLLFLLNWLCLLSGILRICIGINYSCSSSLCRGSGWVSSCWCRSISIGSSISILLLLSLLGLSLLLYLLLLLHLYLLLLLFINSMIKRRSYPIVTTYVTNDSSTCSWWISRGRL